MEKIQQHLLNYQSLKDVSNRFNKAVEYCQNTLGIQFQLEAAPINHQYSLQEINEFLTELSYAFAKKKVNQENGNRLMKELYVRKISLNHLTEKYNALIEESKIVFTKIKEEVIDQITDQTGNNQSQLASLKERQSNFTLLLNRTIEQLAQFEFNEGEIELETDPNAAIRELESNIEQLKDNMEKTAQIQSKLDLKKEEEEQVNSQIQTGQNALNEMIEELKQLNATGIQLEKQFAEVEQITKQNPEAELEKTQKKSNELKKEIEVLKEKIGLLPIAEVLHKEWKSLLEHSTEHDLEEIRKLYVKHANVIGTTCVASANKEFMDNYPIFDVVIIDEVSKATPPELLLPMLKGKKIILVGDHHQLPPLIGDETFEETLEEVIKDSNTFEQKRELE
ncbi:hypothetical protein RhiirA1_404822, partial [Rhizophagus irregularis]